MSLLGIGLTGLNAAQAGLSTASHNIANANVAGYTRQGVIQGTNDPMFSGVGFFGQGTRVESVRRMYSAFLETQVMTADANRSQMDVYASEIKQLDNLLADETAGLSPALQSFFKGVQDVASNASSIPSRQSMLSFSEALVTRFHSMSQRFEDIRDGVEAQLSQAVSSINSLARQISELNLRIVSVQAAGPRVPANDLQDQRNRLLAELNREIRTTSTIEDDGSINVFIGTGQPLVVGSSTFSLTTAPSLNDGSRLGIGLQMPNGSAIPLPESLLSGGRLGGLLQFRSETLDRAQNALGRVAVGISQTINAQHRLGQDLNGNLGGNYFLPLTARVQNLPDPTTGVPSAATLSVAYTNVANLTDEDYTLTYDGANYLMRRSSDGGVVYNAATLPTDVAGFTVTLGAGAIAAGDRFLIQPTRYAAGEMQMSIKDTRLVAAAAPFRTASSSFNSGAAEIGPGSVVSTTGFAATQPHIGDITVTFNAGTNQFILGGAAAGVLAYNPATEAAGKTFTLASPNLSFEMSGVPANGDVFTLSTNSNGVSDNRNALILGQLQSVKTLIGGGASYQAAYAQLVSDVGTRTREVNIGLQAQTGLYEQALAAQQSVSGVNLDEEAASLIRFQQAYQASARVMNIAGNLFDEILSIAR